jgi:methylated-DNA-[protein]-cysteine S-methyltransferase
MMSKKGNYRIFKSSLGWAAIAATERGIVYSVLPMDNIDDVVLEIEKAIERCGPALEPQKDVEDMLVGFYGGREVTLEKVVLDVSAVSPFSRRVYEVVKKIPRGTVLSYGEVAALSGNPRAARAVGSAMAKNPFPPFVPCHRVIASDGGLCGFGGERGLILKKKLLELEGVTVVGSDVSSFAVKK